MITYLNPLAEALKEVLRSGCYDPQQQPEDWDQAMERLEGFGTDDVYEAGLCQGLLEVHIQIADILRKAGHAF